MTDKNMTIIPKQRRTNNRNVRYTQHITHGMRMQ